MQYAIFSKSPNPRNIDKNVSDIRIRFRFPFESSFWKSLSCCKPILPAGYPTGNPDSDHLWWSTGWPHQQVDRRVSLGQLHLIFHWI